LSIRGELASCDKVAKKVLWQSIGSVWDLLRLGIVRGRYW